MKKRVWLSFDLGIRGDYEGLYAWLDNHGAKECGDTVATFMFEYESDLEGELVEALKQEVEITRKSRFYLVWNDQGRMKGHFVIGKRMASPWQGHGALVGEEAEYDVEE